jgi:hypothetical protein
MSVSNHRASPVSAVARLRGAINRLPLVPVAVIAVAVVGLDVALVAIFGR